MAGAFLIVFTLFWSAFTLGFDGMMASKAYQQYESGSFPSVTGTVTHSELEQRTSPKGHIYYTAVVHYQYDVSGQTYWGDRLRFGAGEPASPSEMVDAHPVNSPGKSITTQKIPANPCCIPTSPARTSCRRCF